MPRHVEKFGFIIGVQKRSLKDQDPVDIAASELVGKLHDALEDAGYTGHDLEQLLVRTVFCLFADDTGIFEPRDIFLDLLEDRTREDGSDLGGWLAQLFQVLNTPEDKRPRKTVVHEGWIGWFVNPSDGTACFLSRRLESRPCRSNVAPPSVTTFRGRSSGSRTGGSRRPAFAIAAA